MSTIPFRRLIALLLLTVAIGCGTTYRKSRPDLPENEREAAELNALHDEFDKALEERRFGEAETILAELEEGMESASRALVMHRTYPILSAQVVRGPKRLRAARRTANVEQIVEDTEALVAEIEELETSFRESGGSDEELDRLDDLMNGLDDQLEDNQSVRRDRRYRDVDAKARTTLLRVREHRATFGWQREAAEQLNDVLDDAPELDGEAADLLAAAEDADSRREVLEKCVEEADELAQEKGASNEALIATSLSLGPLADVRALCQAEAEDASAQATVFRWRHEVKSIYDEISDALKIIEASKTKSESLEAHERAVAAMTICPERVDPAVPGYDAKAVFNGHMGKKNAVRLAEACVKVIGNLEARIPKLRWQAELEELGQRYAKAVDAFEAARVMDDADDRVEAFQQLAGTLEQCQTRAGALAVGEEPQWDGAGLRRGNRRSAASMEKRCRRLLAKAKKQLQKAKAAAE